MHIRPATPDDLHTLLTFEQGVILAERPFDPTLRPDPIYYYDLNHLLHDADSILIVAEDAGHLIASGYATIRIGKPYFEYDRYAYLGFMFVDPAYRGKGVNQLIMSELANWCTSKNIREMKLQVYHDNVSAIRAYEKVGFKQDLIEMRFRV